jgi:hypothetical protein
MVDISIPKDSAGAYQKCSFYSYAANHTAFMYNGTTGEENFTIGVNATLQRCSEWVYERSVFKETYTSEVNFI